jgi:orotidine-5'-phosphate decarboxylase
VELRDRLALALDVDDLVVALRLAQQLQPWFGVSKVGLELYTAAGPDAVATLHEAGFKVFLDLKLHDIPTTVRKAARVVGALGTSYLTLHAHGGPVMLRAGVDGLTEGASAAGMPTPMAVAVTVLTSDADAPSHILGNRITAAVEGGCGGVVCAAADVREAKQLAPRLTAVVPGIRLPGADTNDQARASTPQQAIAAGADLLVIGRTVTAAADPPAAAAALTESLAV